MSTAIIEKKPAVEPLLFTVTAETVKPMAEKYLALKINGVNDKAGLAAVKKARSDVRSARTTVEDERQAAKRFYLEGGRKVDEAAKELTALIAPVEKHLVDQLEAVDAELKRIEDAKLDKRLEARIDSLSGVGGIPLSVPGLPDNAAVRSMTDDRFNDFVIEMKELNDRLMAEAKAKQEEVERQRIESERLAKERAEFERLKAEESERQRIENEKNAAELAAPFVYRVPTDAFFDDEHRVAAVKEFALPDRLCVIEPLLAKLLLTQRRTVRQFCNFHRQSLCSIKPCESSATVRIERQRVRRRVLQINRLDSNRDFHPCSVAR